MTFRSRRISHALLATLTLGLILFQCGRIDAQQNQGWTEQDRAAWYRATQGSRLMPESWFMALEQAGGTTPFSDMGNLTSFGFIAPPASLDNGLPVGFAKDRQAEDDFIVTGLSWYEGQPKGAGDAENWIGLNCAACHTAQIDFEGQTLTVDGGPNLLDFQSFIEELDAALKATRTDAGKWERFNLAVLDGRDTVANRALLEQSFDKLLAWQEKTDAMNETPMRYGHGRLDAVGHILNKVLMFNGAAERDGNPSDAPVSYPFLWDIWRQEQVQWNGVARNSRFALPGDPLEYGALGRNTGEVLGVFGEVIVTPTPSSLSSFRGYKSSVQTQNLMRLELILRDLKAPKWPGEIDQGLAETGKGLFAEHCASCHKTPDLQVEGEKTEVMVSFEETLDRNPEDLTDIWMACNAYLYTGPSGPMRGSKDVNGNTIGATAPVANMLAVAVKGSLLGDKSSIVKEGFRNFFGIRRQPTIIEAAPDAQRIEDRFECLNTKNEPLLAYKARPLDGIWATAPYLHNGSVASLYELLLPADERMKKFWVGNRAYDTDDVGYKTTKPEDGNGIELEVRDANGNPIDGNSNEGHEYGARAFTEDHRRALVEYMKTL